MQQIKTVLERGIIILITKKNNLFYNFVKVNRQKRKKYFFLSQNLSNVNDSYESHNKQLRQDNNQQLSETPRSLAESGEDILESFVYLVSAIMYYKVCCC